MEAPNMSKGSGGEVRRIHIIYFLSHMGRIEHPHLIRVHHLNRNGVYLRDVKRWLADLRGKEMPEAFSWSYKRRYKSGYVWQDLLDDDLITPISDNEYVLKGSEIFPTIPFETDAGVHDEKKTSTLENDKHLGAIEAEDKQQELISSTEVNEQRYKDPITDALTKTLSEIYEESPTVSSEVSTLTDDSIKQEEDPRKQNCHGDQTKNFKNLTSCNYYSDQLDTKKLKGNRVDEYNNSIEITETPNSSFSLLSSSQSPFSKSNKSNSRRTSKMLRSLITCGAVDTNDAVLVTLQKSSNKPIQIQATDNKAESCRGEIMGGSTRVFGTEWNHHQQRSRTRKSSDGTKATKQQAQQTKFGSSKVVSSAYKPVGAPACSQCGKSFKPEKLHAHMKSCKGMKTFVTTASASFEKASYNSEGNQLIAIS